MALAAAQTGSVMLLDERQHHAHHRLARPPTPRSSPRLAVAEGEGIAGWVLASRQSLIVEDLKTADPKAVVTVFARRSPCRSSTTTGSSACSMWAADVSRPAVSQSSLTALESLAHDRSRCVEKRPCGRTWPTTCTSTRSRHSPWPWRRRIPTLRGATRPGRRRSRWLSDRRSAWSSNDLDVAARRGHAARHRHVGRRRRGHRRETGQLSTVEWGMLKMHPVIAAEILAQAPALTRCHPDRLPPPRAL